MTTATEQFTTKMRDAIIQDVNAILRGEGEGELFGLEVKPMADGSGNWAVFSGSVDEDNSEHTVRTVVGPDGWVSTEELN